MTVRSYNVQAALLQPAEIEHARSRLGVSQRDLAEMLLLSPSHGRERIHDWEQGKIPISGPASQAIRLWLALKGKGPAPLLPSGDTKPGVSTYRDLEITVTPEMIAAGLDALFLLDPNDSYEVVASLLTEIFTKMKQASGIR